MLSNFWIRHVISWLQITSGMVQLPERETEWPAYFDNTDGIASVKRPLFFKERHSGIYLPYKGLPNLVPVESKVGVEAHITAVAFGTTSSARKFWLKLIESGTIPEELCKRFGAEPEAQAQRMALHQRFWKVPYHWVGLLNGDILHNNDIARLTYHGNGGNGLLVGVCLEGNYPGLEKNRKKSHNGYDEHTILTGRGALRLSVKHSRDLGAPIGWLYCHRQYSDGRLGDPGEGWWREIGLPIAKEMDLKINYDFTHGTGNRIPREWDENGLVDYRGRSIRSAA